MPPAPTCAPTSGRSDDPIASALHIEEPEKALAALRELGLEPLPPPAAAQ